jgi:hypothetical protein
VYTGNVDGIDHLVFRPATSTRVVTPNSCGARLEHLEIAGASFVLLSVRDYGVWGLEAELTNIFNPFLSSQKRSRASPLEPAIIIADQLVHVHGARFALEMLLRRAMSRISLYPQQANHEKLNR